MYWLNRGQQMERYFVLTQMYPASSNINQGDQKLSLKETYLSHSIHKSQDKRLRQLEH